VKLPQHVFFCDSAGSGTNTIKYVTGAFMEVRGVVVCSWDIDQGVCAQLTTEQTTTNGVVVAAEGVIAAGGSGVV
jgi:hypothetical protein